MRREPDADRLPDLLGVDPDSTVPPRSRAHDEDARDSFASCLFLASPIAACAHRLYGDPEQLVAEIEAESRGRGVSKSDVVRDRLQGRPGSARGKPESLAAIADLVGSVAGLPPDLSSRRKHYLCTTGYGRKRPR